ncbi:MAG: heme exporter protein CcmB [Armatimonadetes bacterium]|nr:heme exporter protein CcmB [Armatimonadota bacterium]
MATASSSLAANTATAAAVAVLRKDLLVEFRTRFALAAIGMFALTTLVAVSFAVGLGAAVSVQAALLWVVLYFAALSGLTRGFVAEEDGRTADALRLAASGTAVYWGKFAFNLLLLAALSVLLLPGFVIFMGAEVKSPGLMAASLAAGCFGLTAALTFTAALVAQARSRGALGAVVSFPLVAPLLKLSIDSTQAAMMGDAAGWGPVVTVAALGGIVTIVAVLLFDSVWTA